MIPSPSISGRGHSSATIATQTHAAVPGFGPAFSAAHLLEGTRTGWAMRVVYFVADLVAVAPSLVAAKLAVDVWSGNLLSAVTVLQLKLYGVLAVGLLTVSVMQRTYAAIPPRPVRLFRGWVLGATMVCATEIMLLWLLNVGAPADGVALALATALAIPAASFGRAICRMLFGSAAWWGTRVLVVGSGGLAARAFAGFQREPQWGLRPVGFVDEAEPPDAGIDSTNPLGPLDRLDELAAELNIDRALIAVHSFDADDLADLLSRAGGRIRHWIVLPTLDRFPSMWLEQCEAARLPAFAVTNRLAFPWSFPLKRAFDVAVTFCAGLVALPLIVPIALMLRLTSPGPILYGQERIGRHGRRFTAWKFRTMISNADAVLASYLAQHPELAAEWEANRKLKRDPRITGFGRWLRAISLDELPQIWNVLVGDMSLVGPRPIVAAEIDKYADRYQHYVKVQPGITGLWQVSGRNNTTYEERVDLDVYYVRNWSLWLDFYILACTVKVVLLSEGAF